MKSKFCLFILILLLASCSVRSKKGIIVNRLEKASKLSTVEVVISKNVYKRDKHILSKDDIFLARTEAIVKFGVDFGKIKSDNIQIKGDEISLKLPPVEITNFSYPAEKFFVDTIISYSRNNSIKIEEIDELYRLAEVQIRQSITQLNMTKTVEQKTSMVVKHLCKNMGFKIVEISFDTTNYKLFKL